MGKWTNTEPTNTRELTAVKTVNAENGRSVGRKDDEKFANRLFSKTKRYTLLLRY